MAASIAAAASSLFSPLQNPYQTLLIEMIYCAISPAVVLMSIVAHLILVLIHRATGDLVACESALTEVLERFLTIVPNDTNSEMAVYSGKWIGDLGNYFDCIDAKEANYALFVMAAERTRLVYGLCGPGNCTVEDYQALLSGFTSSSIYFDSATI
jgi:hypothetical protein